MIDVRIWFLLNVLRMHGQILTKFCMHITIDKIYVWIVTWHQFFKQIYSPEYFLSSDSAMAGLAVRSSGNSSCF